MHLLRHRFLCSALCLLSSLVGLSSCAKRETPVEEGIRTKTLLVGNRNEPADLDPPLISLFTDANILMALFEGLTALDEKSAKPVPAAAERWETSPDGLTWTFHLRAGLRWSNGEPLTADDFVQSWRRALSPAVACPNADHFSAVKNADAFNSGKLTDPVALGFAAPAPRTVVITLTQPTPILPMLTALPCWLPINPRVLARFGALDKRGTAWTRPGNFVGNGPFTLTEWKPEARLVTTKNPHYWDAANNRLERVIFFPTGSAEGEELNFRAGQLHVTFTLPLTKLAGYRTQAATQVQVDPFLGVTNLNFNCGKPPFDNQKVRRALALSVDREAIARAVYFGAWKSAPSFTPNPCGDYVPRAQIRTDFEAARRLLAEAGYPGGRGLPVLAMQTLNDSNYPRAAEALQAMWRRELGVVVTIEAMEQKTLMRNLHSKAHTLALFGWIGEFPDPAAFLRFFTTGAGNNLNGWSNPTYDRLFAEAARTADAAARLELLQQAEELLLADTPIAPVTSQGKVYLKHPAVKGYEPAPLGHRRYQLIRLEK